MKNIFLILSLVLTITACSDKRESDIDTNFGNTVNNPSDALQALPSSQTTNLNTPFNAAVPFVVNSTNTNTPVFSIINQPVNGTVSINPSTGAYVYTPNNNYSGPDLFTWQVQQGSNTAQSSVNITVVPANQPPVANNSSISTNEDTPVSGTATGSDPNGDSLTYVLVSQPTHGSIVFNPNGTFTYTPNSNYFGPDSFTFKVNDGQLDSNTSTISLTVNPVNDAPVASNSSFTIPEDTPYSGNLVASDVENNVLTYAVVSSPLHGNVTVNPSTGSYVYTPNSNYVGTDSFTFRVNDGTVNSNIATVSITVTPLNDAPLALSSSFTTPEDTVYNGLLTGIDPDGDLLTYIIVSNPTKGTLVLTNNSLGTYTYTPNPNTTGVDSFTYKVNDGQLDSPVVTVSINITPVNDAPIAFDSSFAVNAGASYNGQAAASDIDSSTLIYSLVTGPTKGTLVFNPNGSYVYTANNLVSGTDSFTFKVNDGQLDSNVATITVNLNAINQPPVANNLTISTNEDTAVNASVVSTDPDNNPLAYSIVSLPANGGLSFNGATGNFTYTPNSNYFGTDTFTYKSNDGQLDSNIATVTINVNSVNDVPVAQGNSFIINEDQILTGTLVASDADGDVLTYSIITSTTNGTVSLTGTSFTYTPNLNYTGSDSFTFRVNDGTVNSNVATISITVNPLNDPPVVNNMTLNIPEDTPISSNFIFTDADGPVVGPWTIVSSPTKGTVNITNSSTGAFTYTPNLNQNGVDTFQVKLSDSLADSNVATITINISPVNDAPVAFNGSFALNPGQTYNGNLLASDVDGDSLSYTIISSPTKGTVSVNSATGAFSYTANLLSTGTDNFTFRVNDGSLNSNVATVSVSLNLINIAPVALSQSFTTPEDTAFSSTLTATDINGDTLTYILVSGPANGLLVLNPNGSFTYTPNANYNGTDSFTFKANDGQLDSNIATVNLNVTPVNDAPMALDQTFSVLQTVAFNNQATATDIENSPLTYILVSNTTKGTLVFNSNGSFTYTANANATGSDSFTFKVNDGQLDSNIATITFNVNGLNQPPVANNLNLSTPEDQPLSATLSATDVNLGDVLTYSIVTPPANGSLTLNNSTGSFVFTPNLNFNGVVSFTYKANDGQSDSNIATVTINVTPLNDAPVANNQSVSTPEDVAYSGNLVATDVDGNPLTYSVVSNVSHGTLTVNSNGSFTYTPNANYNGPDSFTFKANDGTVNSNTATVSISVVPVNDAPIANNLSFTTPEETTYSGNLTASDVDGNSLTYSLVSSPVKGTLTLNSNGSFVYTPGSNQIGSDVFTFKVNDGQLDSNIAVVSISITQDNDAPMANNQSVSTPEDTPKNITLTASDADGDSVTYTIVSSPVHGTLTGTAPNLTYTPNANYTGSDSFTFKVNDGTVDSNVATISISVTPINDAPVANNQSLSTPEDTSLNITLTASDVDGNSLSYTVVSGPVNGTLTGTGANRVYTPNPNFNGGDVIIFKANDGTLDSNLGIISINVTPVNDSPVAFNQTVTTPEDTSVNIALLGSDSEGNTLTYSIVSVPVHGTLSGTGSNRIYTPNANYTGLDSFTFKVNDGTTDSNVATVSITVTPINDPPVANNQSITVIEDTVFNGNLTASDVDGDTLTYTALSNPTKGVLTVNANGSFTYTPNSNQTGADVFTFRVNDGTVNSNIATVSITITPANDIPVANNQSVTTPEDTPVNITLTGSDADGDSLTYAIVSGPTNGTLTGTGANRVYTPNANFNGSDTFTFKVNDGTSDSNIATISLSVSPVNDLPVANNQTLTNVGFTVPVVLTATDVDGDSLTYTLVSNPTQGTLSGTAPNLTYTPNSNTSFVDSFTFKANDGLGDSNVATITINFTAVTPGKVSPIVECIQPKNNGYYYAWFGYNNINAFNVSVPIGTNNKFTPSPDNQGQPVNFLPNRQVKVFKVNNIPQSTVLVWKLNTSTATASFTGSNCNEAPLNNPPLADNQNLTMPEDTSLNITLTGSDADGDILGYVITQNPTNGTLTGTGANRVYTPNANFNGTEIIKFKTDDGLDLSNEATLTIVVSPVNDAPVASNSSFNISLNQPYSGSLIASDVDGNTLTYSLVTNPSNGTVVINNPTTGAFTYTPNNNFLGSDSFTFKVNDGTVDSNVATVSFNIDLICDLQSDLIVNGNFEADTVTTSEWQLFNQIVGWKDQWSLSGTCGLPVNQSSVELQKNSSNLLPGSTQYLELDSDCPNSSTVRTTNLVIEQEINAQVGDVIKLKFNHKARRLSPGINKLGVKVGANEFVLDDYADTNWKLQEEEILITSQDLNSNGKVTVLFEDLGTADTFGIFLDNVSIKKVSCANPLSPQTEDLQFSINRNQVLNNNLQGTDPLNSPLTYSITQNPISGTVSVNPTTGVFSYTPNLNFVGSDSFKYKVNNGTVDSNVSTVQILVVNTAPIALSDNVTTNEDTPVSVILVGTDSENDSLTYSVLSSPSQGTLSGTAPNLTYTPPANYSGVVSLTYKVNDGLLDSNVATITITVVAVNDVPVANNQSVTTPEDTPKNITLTGTDVEGSSLTYTIVAGPINGTLSGTGANRVYTPNANYNGPDSFTFKVNDGTTDSNVATVSITVTPVSDVPVANNQSVTTPEDTPKNITLTGLDADGNTLTYTVLTNPTHGTLSGTGANRVYTPNANYNGPDSFTFKVNDGTTDSNTATVSITVTPVNDAPVANNQSITVNQNSSNNSITLVGTDPEGNSLSYVLVSGPTNGTLTGTGSNRSYTPNPNYFGNDSFTFKVNDGQADSNIATVSITVRNIGDWCNQDFAYSHKLLLNNQDQGINLTNFPVMIKLNSKRINYTDIKPQGADLRFYDSNCNLLAHEIERWNPSGDSTIWVKVPQINAHSNASFIWMQYGNAAANDAQNKNAVWSDNFAGAWHLEETTGQALDSTSNANNLTPFGSPLRNVGGRIAGADQMDSTDDGFLAPDNTSLRLTNSLTMESWVYLTDYTSRGHIFEKHFSSGSKIDYALFIDHGYPLIAIGGKEFKDDQQLHKNQWYHVAGTYNKTNNTCKIYINGVEKYSTSSCSVAPVGQSGASNVLKVGNDSPGNNVLKGAIDELRISSTLRPIEWIRAQHLSMTDGMVSYGSRRTLGDNWNHALMTIKANNDDGKIYVPGNGLYVSGHNGVAYQGSASGKGIWGYYRFQLPANLPVSAQIKKVSLRLYGRDKVNWTNQQLQLAFQNSANAPVVSSANQFPGGSGGITQIGVQNWGPNLNWMLDDWNDSPDIKNSLINLISAKGALNSGNYIQVWVTRPIDSNTSSIEVGSEDNAFETINHGQLMIEWE